MPKYCSVSDMAKTWGMSERTVRNYCAAGKIPGAFVTGKTWNVPADAVPPDRINKKSNAPATLSAVLRMEKERGTKGGIYHKTQIELTYNSNHMEGSRLTHDQTRFIYETNTLGADSGTYNVDDIVETANHFRCIDFVIENAEKPLTEAFIKQLHRTLKDGTTDSRKSWFAVGAYKNLPNEVGGKETTPPGEVTAAMKALLAAYDTRSSKTLEDIVAFHVAFENIHPFQDGNGRVGRLLLFKECLKNNVVPFIIDDDSKLFYYRGLQSWNTERGYLLETCRAAQDKYKAYLDYFKIPYQND